MSFINTMDDARGIGSPKKYRPYQCWSHQDRHRQFRNLPPDEDDDIDDDMFAVGFVIESGFSRDNLLEVCRLCRKPLNLPEHRGKGEQPAYCSDRCKQDVHNARRRAKRRANRPRPEPKMFDLDGVYIAGVGKLDYSPEEWNRLQPRSDPSLWGERPRGGWSPAGGPLRRGDGREGYEAEAEEYSLPVHRSIMLMRHNRIRGSVETAADRIARRYGTGGSPMPPELPHDWDRVTIWWRYPGRGINGALKQVDDNVWFISQ
ncbi:hypothetical protein [Rhodococcus wratislaviensis]|uniref:hypothetical protein n=1 Tax=Rhodococcus wratislaviensis TaxID=44752 RepID=UPI000F57C897|nr:hypothetical protein [Rhodococcus wratislaviensis]